jgi:hypothetical protein
MTNREKIILGVAALALGYGAIELLMPRTETDPFQKTQATENVTAFVAKVAEATQGIGGESAAMMVRKAESTWTQDPFAKIPKPTLTVEAAKPERPERLPPPDLFYTGYIEAGGMRLAIINGQEYTTGDTVDPGGFTLKSILPTRVTLVSAAWGTAPLVLPLKDSE